MFGKLALRESKFFDLFSESANLIVKAAVEFRAMLDDLPNLETRSNFIKDIEHDADEIAHRTIELLHKTFITPMDRDDIHRLITKLDDVTDFIEAAAQRFYLYQINHITPELKSLADVCVLSCVCVQKAVHGLSNLKNTEEIIKNCVEINRLENESDQIMRSAMAKLFREEPDTRQLIKVKEIYELLEEVTDQCEDVANLIDGILLEYA